MFETLFGPGMPLAARFFIAFLVVLVLIGLTAWLVRRFGSNRLGNAVRGRQPRLAVIDAAAVDGRRRLVLIRRDNIEHLLMIGGPSDVVVEANIVRATNAREIAREPVREAAKAHPIVEPALRAIPLGESQPPSEPPAPVTTSRPAHAVATEEPWLPPEPGARPRPADTRAMPAAELAPRISPPEPIAPSEPMMRTNAPPIVPPPSTSPSFAAPATPPSVEPPAPPQPDHNLADMAQQLEAALRRTPASESRPPVTDPLIAPPPRPAPPRDLKPRFESKLEPKFETKLEPKSEAKFEFKSEPKLEPKFEPPPAPRSAPTLAPAKTPLDSLEEEMATLLGRQTGKS